MTQKDLQELRMSSLGALCLMYSCVNLQEGCSNFLLKSYKSYTASKHNHKKQDAILSLDGPENSTDFEANTVVSSQM